MLISFKNWVPKKNFQIERCCKIYYQSRKHAMHFPFLAIRKIPESDARKQEVRGTGHSATLWSEYHHQNLAQYLAVSPSILIRILFIATMCAWMAIKAVAFKQFAPTKQSHSCLISMYIWFLLHLPGPQFPLLGVADHVAYVLGTHSPVGHYWGLHGINCCCKHERGVVQET